MEQQPAGIRRIGLLILPILLTAVVYVISTTGRGVIDYDEGYYAQAAKGMAESGDWVTPYVNGVRFLEKPPFLYWVTAASFKIFGINEFALRFPTALAVVALVWIVMLIARRLADERAAVISGLITAFCTGTYFFTRETLHDVWLVLFLALAMHGFVEWYLDRSHSRRPALLFYAGCAGAVMCKSLIGIAFPLGIVAVFFLLSRELPRWRTLHVIPGSLLFLILTIPWHWLAASRNQGFLNFFFVGEQFLRFLGRREPPVLWSLPLLTFWALILVWLFPWTAFLPAAIAESLRQEDPKRNTLVKLAIAWAGVVLVFFSISSRLEHYAFPALPALALLIAVTLSRSGSKAVLWAFRGLAFLGILALVIGAGAGIWLMSGHGFNLTATGRTDTLSETDFTIMSEMPPAVLSNLIRPAALTLLSMAIGFPAALWLEKHRRRMRAVICVAAVMIVICGATHWSLKICEGLISSKRFAIAVASEARAGDRLVVMGDYEGANSLNFYEPLKIQVFDGQAYALVPGMKFPESPQIVLSSKEFNAAWLSPDRIFALVPTTRTGDLKPQGTEILRVLDRVLIRNH